MISRAKLLAIYGPPVKGTHLVRNMVTQFVKLPAVPVNHFIFLRFIDLSLFYLNCEINSVKPDFIFETPQYFFIINLGQMTFTSRFILRRLYCRELGHAEKLFKQYLAELQKTNPDFS